MPLDLLKRAEKQLTLTGADHDSNLTAIENAVNGKADTGHTHAISDVSGLQTALAGKQATLTSGGNIKTINNEPILGPGNIVVPDINTVPDIIGNMFIASGGGYNPTTGILTFPSSAPLVPVSDPRMKLLWDADLAMNAAHYGTRYSLQARDFPPPAQNTLNPSLLHSDNSVWVGRESSGAHSNKQAITFRLRQGQGGHWASDSTPTLRAELHGPSDETSGPITSAFDENGGTYWIAFDLAIDSDIATNTGSQYGGRNILVIGGLHSQDWANVWPHSSGQDSMRMWLIGNTLIWGHAAPGTGNSKTYDMRPIPLNTSFTSASGGGLDYGDPITYQLADVVAGQRIRLIAKVTLSNSSTHNPRTEVWTQQGDGALVKRVDYSGPNTFSTGIRYWKHGLYSFDASSTWWGNKNTRTSRVRSLLLMSDGVAAGYPPITESALLAWMNR